MQISNIDCCKPRRKNINFTSSEISNDNRPRFKHYEELTDDALRLRSVIKAHDEVKNGGKVQALKALPVITAGIIGTSIAIAQPGKLSARAAAGLGFLALAKTANVASNFVFKKMNEQEDRAQKENKEIAPQNRLLGALALTAGVVLAAKTGAKYLPKFLDKHAKPVMDFVKKDTQKLAKEINSSKLGTFVEQKLEPFMARHEKAASVASVVAPIATLFGAIGVQNSLEKGISKDIKDKTLDNYVKGKIIQAAARDEFNKIDATEV